MDRELLTAFDRDGAIAEAQARADRTTRRGLLGMTLAGAGALVLTRAGSARAAGLSAADVDILNYALTLEYLETAFYTQATKRAKGLSGYERRLTRELRDNESAHVDALAETIKSLGGKPVRAPAFDFGGAFASRGSYLKTANALEDTGVSAYNGAGPSLQDKQLLGAAGSIVQVEARHAAAIRFAADGEPAPRPFDRSFEPARAQNALQTLLAG